MSHWIQHAYPIKDGINSDVTSIKLVKLTYCYISDFDGFCTDYRKRSYAVMVKGFFYFSFMINY